MQLNDYNTRFGALSRLYGDKAFARLQSSHIAVVGLGGVGSWVVEALARSGIGELTLIDMDEVCLSNVNRQIHALDGTVGRSKAEVLSERITRISPNCAVHTKVCFFTESTAETLLEPNYDMIVDTIDSTQNKCLLIAEARKRGLKLVTCGGAGGRVDPLRLKLADLARTINDPLLDQVRKRLRRDYGFSRKSNQKFKIDCVYTDELPVFPRTDGSVASKPESGADYRLNCDEGFGSATFVTGAMGFMLAAHVVKKICCIL